MIWLYEIVEKYYGGVLLYKRERFGVHTLKPQIHLGSKSNSDRASEMP
jgi:hypothetical protein